MPTTVLLLISYLKKGKGWEHNCMKSQAVSNIIEIAESLEQPSSEQLAAAIIKNKMKRENIEKGEQFKLSTGGNPLFITAGISDTKTKRAPLKQISFQTIMELSNILDLSRNKTKKLCTALRRNLGSTTSVESNIFEKMDLIQDKLGEFYETKTEHFVHNNEVITRSLVFVNLYAPSLRKGD